MAMYDDTDSSTNSRRRLESIAQLHNPEQAAEYERIRREVPDHKISPLQRVAMGYSESAREAAEQLENEK